jgi:hypothetical protein
LHLYVYAGTRKKSLMGINDYLRRGGGSVSFFCLFKHMVLPTCPLGDAEYRRAGRNGDDLGAGLWRSGGGVDKHLRECRSLLKEHTT